MIYNWDRILEDLIKKYDNRYTYFPEDYYNTKDEISIKCNKCNNNFQITLQKHRKGKECPLCLPTDSKSRRKLNINEVEAKLINAEPYYDFDISTYIRMGEKMKFFCKKHGEFWQRPNLRFSQNQGCPSCAKERIGKNRLLSLNEVKKVLDSQSIFYEYDINTFCGVLGKMTFICPIHGKFKQSYLNRSQNKKCLKCSRIEQPLKKRYDLEKVRLKLKDTHNFEPDMSTYQNINSPMKFFCQKHGEFWQRPNLQFTQNHSCPKCSLNKIELNIIKEFNHEFEIHNRKIIKPLEIDFIDNTLKFGIEYNGLFWHSYGKSQHSKLDNYHKLDKNRHLSKTLKMEEQGYQLFHIQSIQWNNPTKKEIWKSVINNKLGKSHKLFARLFKIMDLTEHKEFVYKFLEENHLQGTCGYKYAFGLINKKNEVYSIMTFGKSRFDKNIEYELLRFCNLKNCTIVGGASKLLKYFEKNFKPESIVSYANRDWSQGNLYKQLGFTYSHTSEPNYFYIDNNENIISRQQAQKHKLKNFLESRNQVFNENLSERDNMINNGYRIYYDTGNLVYHKKY